MADKTIASVDKAMEIVSLAGTSGGVKPAEIQEQLNCSISNVHYYLKTLRKHDLLTEQNGEYYVGLGFTKYYGLAVEQVLVVNSIGPVVGDLARETGKVALLAVEQNGHSFYIYQVGDTDSSIQRYFTGQVRDLHCTAFGKAIFANMDEEQRECLLNSMNFTQHTENTPQSKSELISEFEAIRQDEFAYSDREYSSSFRSIASPIWNKSKDNLIGAIGVIGTEESLENPHSRMKARRFARTDANIVKRMAKTARNRIER